MEVLPFIADSAADALTQIRGKLGPEAVVLNVRQLPPSGLSRLWQRARIEVLACAPPPKASDPLADLRQEFAELKAKLPGKSGLAPAPNGTAEAPLANDAPADPKPWRPAVAKDRPTDDGC